ncbi:hypothetical protein [Blastococcus deserti]|uniref:Histidine kinase n=1 Tax=Blastococcus deserti TaxID=2259033 RepID=A0ABW4XE92_9ACTN
MLSRPRGLVRHPVAQPVARARSPTPASAFSERLVEAQEDERARIAADVHDDSVQALAAVGLRRGAALLTARP